MLLTTEQIKKALPEQLRAVQRKVNAAENREAWLNQRMGKFTASVVHNLFSSTYSPSNGKTATSYIYRVAAGQIGARRDSYATKAMQWGLDHEVEAVELYMERTGLKVELYGEDQEFKIHPELNCVGATPDGLVQADGMLQVKCPFDTAVHAQYMCLGNVEDFKSKYKEYYVQVQTEMLVTGRQWSHFVSYDPRFPDAQKLSILKVRRCEDFQEILFQTIKAACEQKEDIVRQLKSYDFKD